jgi:putative phage-type endonuclease
MSVVIDLYPTQEKQLQARSGTIGASILGIGFQTPLQVWHEIRGGMINARREEYVPERMFWGTRLQVAIAEGYRDRTGRKLVGHDLYQIVRNDRYPWLHASPDAFQLADDRRGVLEIKNSARTEDWEDGAPDKYQAQLQLQMIISELQWGTIAVLLNGCVLRHFDYELSTDFAWHVIEAMRTWWERHVVGGEAPAAQASDYAFLRSIFPREKPKVVVELPSSADELYDEWEAARAATRAAGEREEVIKAQVAALLQDAEYGLLPSGRAFQWRMEGTEKEIRWTKKPTRVMRPIKKLEIRGGDRVKQFGGAAGGKRQLQGAAEQLQVGDREGAAEGGVDGGASVADRVHAGDAQSPAA